uniref:Sciellin n=1 Tax=Propithecus coquereli TaxID=379532 RepID=A0A2K6FWL7_PROCO
MSNFALRKTSPTGNDMKSSTQGARLRQQGFHDVNKRRTFLQDNSWIKKRPEEEKDENYGRVVLSRHNSHDALDRKIHERQEPKATISRYRSDDTLDRISDRNDAAKVYKANTLDNQLTNRNMSTFRSSEATKSQPGGLLSVNTANTTASTSAATPVKKKREPAFHPPIPPKPSSPVSSPKHLRQDNRQICPPKPGVRTETNRSSERNIRSQDLDNIIKVATSLQKTDKGEELDNLIKMNKSLNRNQGLDGIFRANLKAEETAKRAKSLESLICVNTRTDKDGKETQDLGSLIKVNQRTYKNEKGSQDLESIIKANAKTDKTSRRGEDLDNVIKVNQKGNENTTGGQSLDNLIKVTPEVNRSNQGDQSLDSLIKVGPETNRTNQGNEDLDKLIKVNPEILTNNQRNQGLDHLVKVNPAVVRNNQSQGLDNLIKVKPSALRNINRDQDLDNLIKVNSHVSQNKNESSNAGIKHAGPKDTVVYTRTYVENSKSPKDSYQENISGKYIQTVYSTSDRSVIERDMCTYCRKPLGVETKMILDELQICCHSTCFKCEICKQPLENLQAGDSIWIYRHTIHCEPCYSKVMAKWIQ